MSPVLLKKLNTAINVYGLEVKSLNIQVSVKAEEFAECARHLKSVQGDLLTILWSVHYGVCLHHEGITYNFSSCSYLPLKKYVSV